MIKRIICTLLFSHSSLSKCSYRENTSTSSSLCGKFLYLSTEDVSSHARLLIPFLLFMLLPLADLQAMGHPIVGDPAYGYYGEANPNGGFSNTVIRSMSPTCATMELRDNVEKSVKESGRMMCLHAKELSLNHPVTGEWVSFSVSPSF